MFSIDSHVNKNVYVMFTLLKKDKKNVVVFFIFHKKRTATQT